MAVLTRRSALTGLVVLLLIAAGSGAVSSNEPTQISEAQAKAALLYNLPSFVEWPAAKAAAPIMVGVAGATDVADALQLLSGGTQPPLRVRAVSDLDDAAKYHVLFVSLERDATSAALLHRVAELPVLTVGDAPGFTRRGGVIRVYFDRSRLRLEISQRNAARAQLHISSKLLALATVVDTDAAR
jgi:hypothetical protein